MFRSDDLEKYVKEVSHDKMNMILINKADYLSPKQRLVHKRKHEPHYVRLSLTKTKVCREVGA